MNPRDHSRRIRQVAFWAAVTATATAGPYFAAIGLYAAAGFSGLPPTSTRLLAAATDFVFAPAILTLVACLSLQARPTEKLPARLAGLVLLVFMGLIYGLRALDLMIVAGWAASGGSLELYGANTPASMAVMFTWGPAIGVGVVLASRLFVGGGLAGWTRRLYVVWGILAIAGWSLTVLDSVISGALPALAAIASVVRIVSYVFPAVALAVTAWLLRDSARAPRRLQARPASG